MSATIWAQPSDHSDTDDCCRVYLVDGFTRNLTPMLQATGSGFTYWGDLIGKTCGDVADMLEQTHNALVADPDKYRALDPQNGWGTYDGIPLVIGQAAQVARQHPEHIIGGSV